MIGAHPIHRKLLDHFLWQDKPFARGQAWVDLILLARYKPDKFMFNGSLVELEIGQIFRSKLTLGKRWGWSRGKTERFLLLLENEHMIVQKSVQHGTLITLLNYKELHEKAFNSDTTDRTTDGTTTGQRTVQRQDNGQDTYNKDNKDNKDKNDKNSDDDIFSAALKICNDIECAHPNLEQSKATELHISQAVEIISELIDSGYELPVLIKAHKFAIKDISGNEGDWKGWKIKYTRIGNWYKETPSKIRWIDYWIDQLNSRIPGVDVLICNDCGKEVKFLASGQCKECIRKGIVERWGEDAIPK